ncbi:Cytochrome P450 734A6 [Ananas comosus]|uniref:Cytochrome P450 734A6 n=1 Tax=Ananas comosus TaxID=4615 RepID=A0A199UQP9_ANACO|nr:Cytochrome P450 734A6 [Ananas comosus]
MGVHHDARCGPDAPSSTGRFAEGVPARPGIHGFIPFGLGARMCIGQNLALLEASSRCHHPAALRLPPRATPTSTPHRPPCSSTRNMAPPSSSDPSRPTLRSTGRPPIQMRAPPATGQAISLSLFSPENHRNARRRRAAETCTGNTLYCTCPRALSPSRISQ